MMIWTLEATPPWRISAADQERDQDDDSLFLDTVAVDDRGAVAAALARVYTEGAGSCACRINLGSTFSSTGHLDLVRVSAQGRARQIVAIWKSEAEADTESGARADAHADA